MRTQTPSIPSLRRSGLLSLALAMLPMLRAQQNEVELAPPKLDLGTLHQGHVVQTSVWHRWPDGTTGELLIETPACVRVLHQHAEAITLAVDTTQLGPLSGTVVLRRGERRAELPIDAIVLPCVAGQPRVLVATGPWHAQSTGTDVVFEPWRKIVATGKLAAHYVVAPRDGRWIDPTLLQRVDTVLLGDEALLQLTESDMRLLQGFVCGGGRLVVCAGPFMFGTVQRTNELLEPFGLRFDAQELAGLDKLTIGRDAIAVDPLTQGLDELVVARPGAIALLDARAKALATPPVGDGRPFLAVARTESGGEVVALGAPLWWTWIGAGAGNAALWRNVLSGARRKPAAGAPR